ncbi:MAG: HEAT repeat domain-containing protein, partial [Verrucomicrobiae bacterium]|nr:HEAT repeat domain-containing protein [Verrucomicrobiae bacterium]
MKRGPWNLLSVGCALVVALSSHGLHGADAPHPVPRPGLHVSLWAREPMVMDPVAVAFDDFGAAYVAETARRSTVDIDIRSHRDWLLDDLANESVDDLRAAFHRWMAPERSLENASWLADLNHDGVHDWQDLREIRERVRRLEDTTGAGRADRSEVLAEGFNEEISGVLAGVLPVGKQVWATAYPNLVRLTVSEGEPPAVQAETVFRGFGVHAAFDGHDLHGLILGPEGRLYFTCGDNGFSVTNREGRRLHYPHTGGVLRMDPDGSNLEVFAYGLRNPQEIAFDDDGNWFAVDNDGDLKDERERFVFVAEGSDSGWRLNWQFREPGWAEITRMPDYNPWVDERMWVPHHRGQPAHIVPAITNYSVGPGSLRFNPGTALSEADRGYFFLIQFPVQKVTAFRAAPRGAGFEMAGEHTVLSGLMASALAFTPQGALCVGDWDGLWEPNGTGALWMLDDPASAGSPLRREVARVLREGMSGCDEAELVRWLAHADQRLRLRAQWELVRRGARRTLLEVAGTDQAPPNARVHALWGLTRVTPPPASEQLPLRDTAPRIRAQAARAAGDLRLAEAVPALVPLLSDPEPPVRFQAAIALGKIGSPAARTALPALVGLLATNNGADPFLRHAGILGLVGAAKPSDLAALSTHPSAAARLGAVVALRRLQSAEVAVFLEDADPDVLRETVRAIHDDDSIPGALEALAALIQRPDLAGGEAVVRRVLNAQLRGGRPEHAEQLMRYAMETRHPEPLRIEALEALGDWDRTPALDRVEGRMRPLSPRNGDLGRTLIASHLESLLVSAGPSLAASATRLVTARGIPAKPEVFGAWVTATNQPLPVRLQALDLLASRDSGALAPALDAAERDAAPELRIAARTARARRDPQRFARDLASLPPDLTLRERQSVLRSAGPLNEPGAIAYLGVQMDQLARGDTPPELALDVLEASRSSPDPDLQAKAAQFDQTLAAGGRSARERLLLNGGDRAAGERVFRTSVTGQCVRCHDAGGEGAQAGPVLAGVGRRLDRATLLESLLDPGARIAEGFGTVSVTLSDGSIVDGLRVRETPDALTLRLSEGGQRDIPVTEIRARDQSTISAMPPMDGVLTLRELRDVVEFLASWR